ncbi:hypothetical protein CJ030_MR1G015715 [Morella rubra]|uniref:Uncharacterized protein n=1 Tax=Morella rubra TaxID=262757 RepID=A0A6A1WJ62_9ROSI|nr:hypothetical protein CJ030_MR1G015715 [Morella rubra]
MVHVQSPHLALGLELFGRGKQETGTRLAEFCAHALLALEEDLYESWLENGKETEAPDIIPSKNMRYNEEPSETLGGSDEENRSVDGASGTRFQDKRGSEPATISVDVGMRDNNDDIMVDADLFHKSRAQVKEPVSSKSAAVPVSNDGSSGAEIDHEGNVFASSEGVSAAKGDRSTTVGVNTSATTEISEKTTEDAFDLDGEDPFPEIFDVEPDSDEEQD